MYGGRGGVPDHGSAISGCMWGVSDHRSGISFWLGGGGCPILSGGDIFAGLGRGIRLWVGDFSMYRGRVPDYRSEISLRRGEGRKVPPLPSPPSVALYLYLSFARIMIQRLYPYITRTYSLSLSVSLSLHLSIYRSVYLSNYLAICLFNYLFIYIYICLPTSLSLSNNNDTTTTKKKKFDGPNRHFVHT